MTFLGFALMGMGLGFLATRLLHAAAHFVERDPRP
jgi:hypothetical protein